MYKDIPMIRTRVYLKDKPVIYITGVIFLGLAFLSGYFMYGDASALFAIGVAVLIGLLLFGGWYLDFRVRNNVIEITPQFLRIDDCVLKEIRWSDISHMKVDNHFSTLLGRFVHLIIYLKNDDKYDYSKQGRLFNRRRADGGIFATNLYNYSEDYKKILEDLSEALESSRFISWPDQRKHHFETTD